MRCRTLPPRSKIAARARELGVRVPIHVMPSSQAPEVDIDELAELTEQIVEAVTERDRTRRPAEPQRSGSGRSPSDRLLITLNI